MVALADTANDNGIVHSGKNGKINGINGVKKNGKTHKVSLIIIKC